MEPPSPSPLASPTKTNSLFPFLPPLEISSSGFLQWPAKLYFALRSVARGPEFSKVDCGEQLCECISDMCELIGLEALSPSSARGFCLYFDDLITRAEAKEFYEDVLPFLANLVLRVPVLLKAQLHQMSRSVAKENRQFEKLTRNSVNLRVLHPQQAGLVLLSQEFVAALLACAFFCLYSSKGRQEAWLPYINFDYFFGGISGSNNRQEQKVVCIMHYFHRISKNMPQGMISYERKVLFQHSAQILSSIISEPDSSFWRKSEVALCPFMVFEKGMIEDENLEALEVDFANKYLGGGVLFHGCAQEEIRFCINPELIGGMVFLSVMATNEAIEIVGAERFSNYQGYSSSFTYAGDFVDSKPRDMWGRRQTRIVAIDALDHAGESQFSSQKMLREANKAFCGFLDHAGIHGYSQAMDEAFEIMHLSDQSRLVSATSAEVALERIEVSPGDGQARYRDVTPAYHNHVKLANNYNIDLLGDGIENMEAVETKAPLSCSQSDAGLMPTGNSGEESSAYLGGAQNPILTQKIGIATGNWGCGAFGGDFELKSFVQWIAASQARRPFVHYYTFGDNQTGKLKQLAEWILKEGWHVGDCWNMMVEYGEKRVNKEVGQGLCEWILPQSGEE